MSSRVPHLASEQQLRVTFVIEEAGSLHAISAMRM
jgi:hypothetical protein